MIKSVQVGSKMIGLNQPCFIIAEAGVNHNGDMGLARELINVAAESGADAVKFQTFKAEALVTIDAPKAEYQTRNMGTEESQFSMLKKLELDYEQFRELSALCQQNNIIFLSTAFDEESADFLNDLQMPAFKIPSGELTNLPLIRHIAAYKKPLLISTGMANLEEVRQAVQTAQNAGCLELLLFHCLSNYPADPSEVNLRAMATMERELSLATGYSDHTLGTEVAEIAVAAGACIIEKHLTLSHDMEGPDHQASLEPQELKQMILRIRRLEQILGNGEKTPTISERAVAQVARRSLVAKVFVEKGALLKKEMIIIRRPGTGLAPSELERVVGRRVVQDIQAGTVLNEDILL